MPQMEGDLSFNAHHLKARFLPPMVSWDPFSLLSGLSLSLSPPTPSFPPTVLPPAPYHNASRWAKVELNDKSILPSEEGDPGGRYKEEWPWKHWFIWLPPRGQDTEDFQLLLRLELTIRTERKGKGPGRVNSLFPGPELLYPKMANH